MTTQLAAAVLLSFAAIGYTQSPVTGRWEGATPNGTPLVVELTATETALTGTITRRDESAPITEGKVSKNTISFKATLGEVTEAVSGEVKGDELRLWLDRQGPENAAVLKRAKK